MKSLSVLIILCTQLAVAVAQEKVPAEKVQAISRQLLDNLGKIDDAQIKIDPDAGKGDAFTVSGAGVLVVPDKNLTATIFEKAVGRIIPLGHLFLKDLAPAKNGTVIPADEMRPLTYTDNAGEHRLTVLLLGIRNKDEGSELVVYGKDEAPLLLLPLRKLEGTEQVLPLELSGEKQDDDTGLVTLGILGKYKAMLPVKRAE